MKKNAHYQERSTMDKVETCQRCRNVYLIFWVEHNQDYNDFGLRHCPFCGLLTDELTKSVMI